VATTGQEELPTFPIQLVDAYLYEAAVQRTERDPGRPSFDVAILSTEDVPEDHDLFVIVEAKVSYGFREDAELEIRAAVSGRFNSET
jgi:hypothetical protein